MFDCVLQFFSCTKQPLFVSLKKKEMEQSFIAALRRHSRQLVREWNMLADEIQQVGISPSQCHTLIELEQEAGLSSSQLAELLVLDKSTTSRTIQALEKRALIDHSVPENDKRLKCYALSTEGQDLLGEIHEIANRQVEQALDLMTPSEQQQVAEGLKVYARALQQVRLQSAFQLRPIEARDNEQVARLIRTVMTEFGAVGEGYSITDPEVDRMFEAYQPAGTTFFVIEKEGQILGCGGIAPLEGGTGEVCELRKMYFYPELRGLGLGKRLLKCCLDAARAQGYQSCYLETLERMWQANKLYEKMGFRPISCQMGATGHSKCDRFLVMSLDQ